MTNVDQERIHSMLEEQSAIVNSTRRALHIASQGDSDDDYIIQTAANALELVEHRLDEISLLILIANPAQDTVQGEKSA